MNSWWGQRRYGVLAHTSLAAVPAWCPIGQYADWYRAHIGDGVSHTMLHTSPLVESLAYHRDRWAHIETYDEFLPFLTLDRLDPDEWVDTAIGAGAGYVMITAKHHDGWCWWDAPNTERTMVAQGPKRNVVAELAAAAERGRLGFGANYSLLDWGDPRHPGPEYVDEVLHPHVRDLVDRYGVEVVRGDGHWAAGADQWRSDELIASLRERRPSVVVNDRWFAGTHDFRSFEFEVPRRDVDEPWDLVHGLGRGFALNQAETDEHRLTPGGVVRLLTEVVARGGHLLIVIGPDRTGAFDPDEVAILRAAGTWIRRHRDLIDRSKPWDVWGSDGCRYLQLDGDLHAIDVSGAGRFDALGREAHQVHAVRDEAGRLVEFDQRADRLDVFPGEPADRVGGEPIAVYRIELAPSGSDAIELFPNDTSQPVALSSMLEGASRGDVVQLGEGTYVGPCRIPDGVTVRGLGADRTTIDGKESLAVALGVGSRIEHCHLTGGGRRIAWLPRIAVRVVGSRAAMLACRVDGHISVDDANEVKISSCQPDGIVADRCEQLTIVRSACTGMGWDCGIDITGGSRHLIDSCEFTASLQGLRLTGSVGATVRNNTMNARWWAVQLIDCEATTVIGNAIESTMRAVDVDGGSDNVVTGNAVFDGDSGCLVQRGAANTEVSGNHWERCRLGLLSWDAGTVRCHDNHAVDLAEATETYGP